MEFVILIGGIVLGVFIVRRAKSVRQLTPNVSASGFVTSAAQTPSQPELRIDLTAASTDPSQDRELAQQFWDASGLSFVIYGPGPIDELAEVLRRRAPQLSGERFGEGGLLQIDTSDLTLIGTFLTGDSGSALVLTDATTDAEFDVENLEQILPVFEFMDNPIPTADGRGSWRTTLFSRGSTSDADLAEQLLASAVVPTWTLQGFVDAKPSHFPSNVATMLLDNGWLVHAEGEGLTIFGRNIGMDDGRSHVATFGNEGEHRFRWSSAIAANQGRFDEFLEAGIALPDGYELEAPTPANEMGWLVLRQPLTSDITVQEINSKAVDMAVFADGVEARIWGDDLL